MSARQDAELMVRAIQRRAEEFFATWKASINQAEYIPHWIMSFQWRMNRDLR